MYGVGGWLGVGLVFDFVDLMVGLGLVGVFKWLQEYIQMGGGVMVFLIDGDGFYFGLMVGEYVLGEFI